MTCQCMSACTCPPARAHTVNDRNSVDSFLTGVRAAARDLYTADGRGMLRVSAPEGPGDVSVLVAELSPAGARQHTLDLDRDGEGSLELPAGAYLLVARTPEFAPRRGHVDIADGEVTEVTVTFEPQERRETTLDDRIKYLRLPVVGDVSEHLVLRDGERMALEDARASSTTRVDVTVDTLPVLKALFGQPDAHWAGRSRFATDIPDAPGSVRMVDEENISLHTRAALREFVYGNSRSVAAWEKHLSDTVSKSAFKFPVWLYRTVDVGPGCVLQIGASGLVCGTLRVHTTGRVRVVGNGPTFVDTLTYEQYGLYKAAASDVHRVVL